MRTPDMRRLACLLALDRNELRRPTDRFESWFRLALIAAFVPLAVVAASSAAHLVHAAGARAVRAGHGNRQVTAVLVSGAPAAGSSPAGSAWARAPARWTANGVTHTGDVPADPGSRAGTTVAIWIDAAGQVQPPPLTATQVTARMVLAAVAAPPAVALALWLIWRGLRWRLDRHRLARWGRAWSVVEPLWTR